MVEQKLTPEALEALETASAARREKLSKETSLEITRVEVEKISLAIARMHYPGLAARVLAGVVAIARNYGGFIVEIKLLTGVDWERYQSDREYQAAVQAGADELFGLPQETRAIHRDLKRSN